MDESIHTSEFWAWFERQMDRHGYYSIRQVERAGGVGNDTVNYRYRNQLEPTDTVIRALARAFDMSFEQVECVAQGQRATIPLPEETDNLTLRELWAILSQMSVEEQQAVLDYALYRSTRPGARRARSRRLSSAATPQSPSASESEP